MSERTPHTTQSFFIFNFAGQLACFILILCYFNAENKVVIPVISLLSFGLTASCTAIAFGLIKLLTASKNIIKANYELIDKQANLIDDQNRLLMKLNEQQTQKYRILNPPNYYGDN